MSPHFEVDAPDAASAQTILRMAESLPDFMEKFFPWPAKLPSHVQIELVPPAQVDFTGPYLIQEDDLGHCAALVRWDAETKFSDVCQAISQASLKSLAVAQDGPDAAAKAPDWLALALGKLLEVGLKPPLIELLSEEGQAVPVLSLRQLMTTPGPYGDAQPVVAINAYWLLRFLVEQCRTPAMARAAFFRAGRRRGPRQGAHRRVSRTNLTARATSNCGGRLAIAITPAPTRRSR